MGKGDGMGKENEEEDGRSKGVLVRGMERGEADGEGDGTRKGGWGRRREY